MSNVATKARFDFVRYANVWEDADVLCEALRPVAAGRRLLSIASAGDNALALLTLDPSEVVAVDLSAAQLACVELRVAAFRALTYPDLLAFLGVRPGEQRLTTYDALRPLLSARAAAFWDVRPAEIALGVVQAGKFERYFATFRNRILPLVHSSSTVRQLRSAQTLAEQQRFYSARWDGWRWRALFAIFFSRFVMGRMGRDAAFFEHVDGPVATRILARTEHALTALPVATNPYLAFILTGNFAPEALPLYLRPDSYPLIRQRLDRIVLVEGTINSVAGEFHGFNLSDIFEYMSDAEHESVYAQLVDRAAPGARLVYWNMLVPRSRPASETRTTTLAARSAELHATDRAWFYQRLVIDQRLQPAVPT